MSRERMPTDDWDRATHEANVAERDRTTHLICERVREYRRAGDRWSTWPDLWRQARQELLTEGAIS